MRILHLAPDEKFINAIHWQFEEMFPDQNKYLIFLQGNLESAKYIKVSKDVEYISNAEENLTVLAKEVEKFDFLILHGLKYFQSQLVVSYKVKAKLIWFFWGGEIYDNPKGLAHKIVGTKTKKAFFKELFSARIKGLFRSWYYTCKGLKTPESLILEAAKKINYFGAIDKEEVNFLRDRGFLNDDVGFVKMTYYPLEFIFKGIQDIRIKGNDILLGNSASITNNHLEAFDLLKAFDLEKRKIIVPLSYGKKKYANTIIEKGKELFKDKLNPLTDFISLSEYNKILQQCNIVIMNHYRQQAVGNVVAMLWMGAKVYLDERNTLYYYFKSLGIEVYSMTKDFRVDNPDVFKSLDNKIVQKNRKLLKDTLGFEVLKQSLVNQLNTIHNES